LTQLIFASRPPLWLLKLLPQVRWLLIAVRPAKFWSDINWFPCWLPDAV